MIPDNLIINADDFGLNSKVNAAIVKCFNSGLINSTSIMVNMPGFSEAVLVARENGFEDKIGLHVCLTHGKPLSDLERTPLVKKDGNFNKEYICKPGIYVNFPMKKAIKKEINSQLDLLRKKNIYPTHINTHHDIHELPWLLPIFLSVAKSNNIKLRICQTWMNGKNPLKPLYRKGVNQIFKFHNLGFTNYFETLEIYNKNISNKESHKITEIMVHPDIDDDGNIIDSFNGIDLEQYLFNLLINKKMSSLKFIA